MVAKSQNYDNCEIESRNYSLNEYILTALFWKVVFCFQLVIHMDITYLQEFHTLLQNMNMHCQGKILMVTNTNLCKR